MPVLDIHLLANTDLFVNDLKAKFQLEETVNYTEFVRLQVQKVDDVSPSFYSTTAFLSENWKGPLFEKRHLCNCG
jgi:hypothetical protein